MDAIGQLSNPEWPGHGVAASEGRAESVAGPTDRRGPGPQRQRRLNPAEVDQVVAEYESGAPMVELACRWNIHRTTVAAHLDRRGIRKRSHKP